MRTPLRLFVFSLATLFFPFPLPLPCFAQAQAGAVQTLDDFASVDAWRAAPADGVELRLKGEDGALRLDFDFHGRGGYAVARRDVDLSLPANYAISFRMRGDAPVNTLEFKLIDPSRENVWWVRRPEVTFPREWATVRYKKRHVTFAWGPKGGGEPDRIAQIEIAITAGQGGRGTVFIDDLKLTELPPDRPYAGTPRLSRARGTATVDFGEAREFGGLVIREAPRSYTVELSEDGASWSPAWAVTDGDGGKDFVYLPESEARYVRVRGQGSAPAAIGIDAQPLEFGASKNAFFAAIAAAAPAGHYPRYFRPEQVYWTVTGVDGDAEEALIDQDGAIEPWAGGLRVEPFLHDGTRLLGWAESTATTPALAEQELPIPSVTRTHGDLRLGIETFADGAPGASFLLARYRVTNGGRARREVRLFLAVRPFQVNPAAQFLGTPGGVAPLPALAWDGRVVRAGARRLVPLTEPSGFGAATFAQGDVVAALARGVLPRAQSVEDPFGHASGALSFKLTLAPGAARDVLLAVPLHEGGHMPQPATAAAASAEYEAHRAKSVAHWRAALDRVRFRVPADAEPLIRTLRSNLAYILVNRDGPAIQPGSRAYARSWIRDGALTSAALLRLGHPEPARAFIEWFAEFQYPDGKVPCCVDHRGADPVPENDSHGEFIYIVAEYWRQTGDAELPGRLWPHVRSAAAYLDTLRQKRRTPEYQAPDKKAYFGMLPESISHEGYSAKPMHSFWDGFFGLRGLDDAALLAGEFGTKDDALRIGRWRDEFRQDLHASVRATMALHNIPHLPGCVELGDFDATSTTAALSPGGQQHALPQDALRATFDRFYEEVKKRRGNTSWQAYTPYELRGIGALVRLGQVERAHELLAETYLPDRRPPEWNHWAEVVYRDPLHAGFIGDMPHTWVGSDYIRSILDLFAYEDEPKGTLRVGCGIPESWWRAPGGVAVHGMRTWYGPLDLELSADEEGALRVRIGGQGLRLPPGGIVVCGAGQETVVRELPAEVTVR